MSIVWAVRYHRVSHTSHSATVSVWTRVPALNRLGNPFKPSDPRSKHTTLAWLTVGHADLYGRGRQAEALSTAIAQARTWIRLRRASASVAVAS